MDRWQNKLAVVTGGSSGIGAAISIDLVKNGLIVVSLARREDRLNEVRSKLPQNLQSNLYPYKCDVTIENDVIQCFEWIKKKFGGTDILVNNAGIVRFGNLSVIDSKTAQDVLNTNVIAFSYCTREAFKSMKERNIDGHVVVINSVAGHSVPNISLFPVNMYSPSKHAVTAMAEVYRQEFTKLGTKVRVTSISPGLVNTEVIPDQFKTDPRLLAAILQPEDISAAVLYAIGTPTHVHINEIIIKPTGSHD